MRCAVRRQALACAGEAFLVSVAAFLLVLAAALASGARLQEATPWGLACFGALLAAAATHGERRASPAHLARRIDRGLGLDGALVTAFESEDRGGLAWVLARNVRARVRPADVRRAVQTSPFPFLALPFVAASLLGISLEGRSAPADHGWLAGAAMALERDVQQAVEEAYEHPQSLSASELRELLEERARVRAVVREIGAAGSAPRDARLAQALGELREELRRAAQELVHAPEVSRALERAALRADGALMSLGGEGERSLGPRAVPDEPDSKAPEPLEGAPGEAGEVAPAETGAGASQAAPGSGPGAPGLVPGPGDGRMSGSTADSPSGPAGTARPESSRASPESAAPAQVRGPWWSEREAALLERWIDAHRRRLQEGESAPPEAEKRRSD